MIKFENDVFYLSAGEACYIFKLSGGVPTHVYFGKRVEPEDDLDALGYGKDNKPELVVKATRGGQAIDVKLAFETAEILEQKQATGGTLNGGKTLCVVLNDQVSKLRARMYYTTYARGGFARSVAIENYGEQAEITCLRMCTLTNGNAQPAALPNIDKLPDFFALASDCETGGAYGFLCAYADGKVSLKGSPLKAECDSDGFILPQGENKSAELLCVYSDCGVGGVSRTFHDILRDNMDGNLTERSPAVLNIPRGEHDALTAVKAAYEMGFGIVTVDGGQYSLEQIGEFYKACAEDGIALGLCVRPGLVQKDSAFFTEECKKQKSGGYKYDLSGFNALLCAIKAATEQNGIKYILFDLSDLSADAEVARAVYALKSELVSSCPALTVEYCIRSEKLKTVLSLCYPVGRFVALISPEPPESFKLRFDIATLGKLGYELSPDVSDGIKRAVRAQKLAYQDDALTVLTGDIYRNGQGCVAVTKDKSKAYAVGIADRKRVRLVGLDEHNLYHVREIDKTFSGAALSACGIELDYGDGTYVLHLRQVADYEN